MQHLENKTALVTGGSRGLGRGIVAALAAEGVKVWALARDPERLDALKREVEGVQTLAADMTDPQVAPQTLRQVQPDILVLNTGVTPFMAPIQEMSWENFSQAWETDVRATFEFGREALRLPLKPGSVVVIVSSGAALGGSPRSGGYAGAKRTQWLLGQYLQSEADALQLGIRFVVAVPRQIVGVTALGDKAATYYSAQQGISKQQFLERMGLPLLTPEMVGQRVVTLIKDEVSGLAFNVTSQGVAVLN